MPKFDRKAKALRCVRDHLNKHGRTPSVRQLAECMGFSSPRSAAVVIDELVKARLIAKRPDGRIQLLDAHDNAATTVSVPILGSAPCGAPLFAEENVEGHIRVDARLAKPPDRYFVLRAKGDSMDQAGIEDGDLVLVRSTSVARTEDRVVALVDGEVTIKALKRGREVAVLEPRSSSSDHKPIYAELSFEIQGIVVSVLA